VTAGDAIDRLVAGALDRVAAWADGRLEPSAPTPPAVLPGSFNPLHDGHRQLARVAEEMLRAPVAFEISVINVDKPPLTADEVRARVAQFVTGARVELTRAPTFLEKARLFHGVTFVVGADTAERLVAPRYYGGDEARMLAALDELAGLGTRFLVAVRVDGTGRVCTLADIPVPTHLTQLFTAIPESRFRVDASSSEIRARRAAAAARPPGESS
jgi:nicotinic acid mononucleotide adenylyltransferase